MDVMFFFVSGKNFQLKHKMVWYVWWKIYNGECQTGWPDNISSLTGWSRFNHLNSHKRHLGTNKIIKLYYFQYFDLRIQINIIYQWNEENILNDKKNTISHEVTARGQGVCPPYWMSCFSFLFCLFYFSEHFYMSFLKKFKYTFSLSLNPTIQNEHFMRKYWDFFILVCSSKWWLNELFWKNDKANVIMWSMQVHLDAD